MRTGVTRALEGPLSSFKAFSAGQKVVAVVGTLALLLAAFMVFRWASAPSYAPLYTNLSSEDAAAVVEQLDADGVPYEIGGGGGTISVPRKDVYSTRIALSGEGLPSESSEGGYALLDGQDISTSQFKEQTDFKRAMEGELAATVEAIDGVDTAVVHLALPPKQVFAEEQEPATASILVDTHAGTELGADQVQGVVHLVASSIDGLDPSKVTVTDSAGRVLTDGEGANGSASGQYRQVQEYQDQLNGKVQSMLDRVFGPGNSTVQVTAVLDFDRKVTESTTYGRQQRVPTLAESKQKETYSGGAGAGQASGVVGPDAQLETNGGGADGSYNNSATVRENGVDKVVEQAEAAPGSVENLHAAVVVDTNAEVAVDPAEIEDLVAAAIGLDTERGDSIQTSVVPFDNSVEEANLAALAAAKEADAAAARNTWIRNGVLGGVVLLLLGLVWRRSRKNSSAREEATSYVVEQLRQEQADRAALAAQQRLDAEAALQLSSAPVPSSAETEMREELAALVERQPDEVAALLRGWLVERS
ncbi:flagellar M-ring protein FliF [Nocardioides seonyuensis]|uniref:Flagellar M-ring protein n=1 Tax=Nocardioides seonyuensis TaxID=2518371 RepID=A0A4P7IF94_9ACTN|nr:flagellar basal-body MS-ring/collar protein FliF [Nocardioides seonyuensis]QBX55243.1 flagellar M-ring protein FliF [Nocardioides seonyuensis]